jgi:DNA repair exonuclease SbcCD ATPase subunit
MQQCNQQHVRYQQEINSAFDADMSALNAAIANCKTTTTSIKQELATYKMQLDSKSAEHTKLSYDKQNWEARCAHILNEIRACETEIASLDNIVRIAEAAKSEYLEHLAVVKKMEVLIRRDFRGYLLTNIITYLDAQAKRYCEIVFGTKELNLYLDGNALDISYCGKMFDGLSGGEKQRVDLILQLAIRDLLSSYLNLSANILVLDEITDFLDKKSCQAVMTLLEKELQSVESVFIVSHHAEELDLPIDSELKIIKNELGISEVV